MGSGKSTQLSQILHRRGYTRSGAIAVTQPRTDSAFFVSSDGTFVAVKEVSLIDKGCNAEQCIIQLEQEIALLNQFEYENIVQYYGTNKLEVNTAQLFGIESDIDFAKELMKEESVLVLPGDLQDNLTTLRICIHEASLTLSSFSGVAKGHIALIFECGSMFEEVLVIIEGLDDFYVLAKETSAAHAPLMTDLSKEAESSINVSFIHGQALYQSYYVKLQETCQSLASLVPAIICYMEELYSILTKFAQTASMHAGNLHKVKLSIASSTKRVM